MKFYSRDYEVLAVEELVSTSNASEPIDSESSSQPVAAAPPTNVKVGVRVNSVKLELFKADSDQVCTRVDKCYILIKHLTA